MGHTIARICVVYLLVRSVLCTGLGRCPLYPPLPNFDIQKMTGTWYEVERSFYLVEIAASCTELDISLNEKGYFLITIKTINRLTGSPSTTYGLGIPSHNSSSIFRYKLNNRMPYVLGRLLPGAGQYNVLFTDYTQYALVWSCASFSIAHSVTAFASDHLLKSLHGRTYEATRDRLIKYYYFVNFGHQKCVNIYSMAEIDKDRIWVLGRQREIEASVRVQIYAIMQELKLDPDRLIISKNNNCTDTTIN